MTTPETRFCQYLEACRTRKEAVALLPLPPEDSADGKRLRTYLELVCLPCTMLQTTETPPQGLVLIRSGSELAATPEQHARAVTVLHRLAQALVMRQSQDGLFLSATGSVQHITPDGEKELDAAPHDFGEASHLLLSRRCTLAHMDTERTGSPRSWTEAMTRNGFRETLLQHDSPLDVWEAPKARVEDVFGE